MSKDQHGADAPLSVSVVDDELVIRMGIERLDGHDGHPTLPALKFDDRAQWVKDVIYELENEDETGGTPLIYLLDTCMNEALEQGSIGVAEDTPTHIGTCDRCHEHCQPLRHTMDGAICTDCYTKEERA